MNIAVVDDDAAENDALCTAVNDWCAQNRTAARVCAFPSADAFLKGLEPGLWDLVFLDIYMPGTSGMEAAARLRALDEKCLIVFCTTSADSAVQSYRVRAFDYLLKPLRPGQVAEVMALACAALHNRSAYIEIKEGWSMVRIPLRDIIYTDYYNHYIHIHTRQRVIKTHLPFAELDVYKRQGDVLAFKQDAAGRGRHQARDGAGQRGFAAAVGARHHHQLALGHMHVYPCLLYTSRCV